MLAKKPEVESGDYFSNLSFQKQQNTFNLKSEESRKTLNEAVQNNLDPIPRNTGAFQNSSSIDSSS